MSWDDEAINGSMGNDDAVLMDSWDAADDAPIMDSWDAEETTATKPAAAKKETTPKPSKKKAAAAKAKAGAAKNAMLDIDELDEKTRKELIKKAEMDSDLNNAADLFEGLGVAEKHPRELAAERAQAALLQSAVMTRNTPFEEHPMIANAESKKDYQDLRTALATAIIPLSEKSALNYSSALTIDLIKDIAKPMSIESIRQTVATLNVLIKTKEKEERQARLAKVRGGTATGGAGKKKAKGKTNLGGAFKKDNDFDLDSNDYGDFGDDDFM